MNHRNNNDISTESIPSPYNFVPLSKQVVFVDEWSDKISHDIPFEKGISGTIFLKVTAESPIYIRNGGSWTKEDRTNSDSPMQDFFKSVNGEHYIPGTSFKGMLRNVLEIASFSKIRLDDKRYSIRDLNNRKVYTSRMTKKMGGVVYPQVKSGWLRKNGETWEIIPCEFARVQVTDLENFHRNRVNLHSKQTSVEKYGKWTRGLNINFDINPIINHNHGSYDRRNKYHPLTLSYKKAEKLGTGSISGRIVFTGQPSGYNHGDRHKKHMEFIFYNSSSANSKNIDYLKKDFEFIHSDENGNPNKEWKFWKKKLNAHEKVPVFFLEDSNEIRSFGLAMMYRLPYKYSIGEALKNNFSEHLKKESIDFAEAIFGYTNKDTKTSFKSRVHIGHFVEITNNSELDCITTVLGGPKPTYYPNYIDQSETQINNGHREYKTFMDKDAKIRGWKQYPVTTQETDLSALPDPPKDRNHIPNLEVATIFKPLPKGTSFKGKMRIHNLKAEELGALLWGLTFGNCKDCRHQIGMAKAYGLGIVKVELENIDLKSIAGNKITSTENSIKSFVNYMNKKLSNNLEKTEQIKTLLAVSNKNIDVIYDKRYPMLDPHNHDRNKKNEFVKFIKENLYLKNYSPCPIRKKSIAFQEDENIFSLEKICKKIKSSKVKEVRKILQSLKDNKDFTKENLNQVYSALKKRHDFNLQKWASDNKNYMDIFEELKKKDEK